MTIFTKEQLQSLERQYKEELEARPKYEQFSMILRTVTTWRERIAVLGQEYREIKGPNNWHESAIKDDFGIDIIPELQKFYAEGIDGLDCVLYNFDEVMEINRERRNDPVFADFMMPVDHFFFFGGHGNGDMFALGYYRDGSMSPYVWLWDHETDERKCYCHGLNDLLARYFSYYGGYGDHLIF